MSFPSPCFSVLKMYMQRLNYQVFPMKTSEAFQIWTKCAENKWEGNRVPLGERKLSFLDLNLSITNGIVSSKIYDKRDDFNFEIVSSDYL